MKISTSLGHVPTTEVNIRPEDVIQNNDIPASLREVNIEYAIKQRLSELFPEVDVKLIDEAVDNVGLFRFIVPLQENPGNASIRALLAKAICFELKCLGAQLEFPKALQCIKNI